MEYVTLYATFADKTEAEMIIDALLEARLIACANRLAEITSYYRWQGKREKGKEIAVLFKTTAAQQEAAMAKIVEMHSYDCPCVTVWDIKNGHAPYLEWIKSETLLP